MPDLSAIKQLSDITIEALALKRQQLVSRARRLAIHRLHAKQSLATQEDVKNALIPVFKSQVKEMIGQLTKTKDVTSLTEKYDPSQPRDDHGRFGSGSSSSTSSLDSIGVRSIGFDETPEVKKAIEIQLADLSANSEICRRMNHSSIFLENKSAIGSSGDYARTVDGNYQKEYEEVYNRGGREPPPIQSPGRIRINPDLPIDATGDLTLGQHLTSKESIQQSVRHEFGHALHDQGLTVKEYDAWDTVWRSKNSAEWSSSVSDYASENKKELFAESFAAYTHRSYESTSKLPKEIDGYFTTLLGSKKQVKLTKAVKQKPLLDQDKATQQLIDRLLPVLAVRMAEAARNQLIQLGVAIDQTKRFNPSQTRVPPGSSTGGQFGTGMVGAKLTQDGSWKLENGGDLPSHLPKNIPPAWRNVSVAINAKSELLVQGLDAKGRRQSIYSDSHWVKQAAKKFAKVEELRRKKESIEKEIDMDVKSKNPSIRENAAALRLIQHTGIRPGGEGNTMAEKQAYSCTTLEGRHVIETGNEVRLQFVGKKGVDLDVPVTDKSVAVDLLRRKSRVGKDGRLFDTNAGNLLSYSKTKDGGQFRPKDFRTAKGTTVAVEVMKSMPQPRTTEEYKRSVKAVAKMVSKQLGNTPVVALQSYIDPAVFSKWRIK